MSSGVRWREFSNLHPNYNDEDNKNNTFTRSHQLNNNNNMKKHHHNILSRLSTCQPVSSLIQLRRRPPRPPPLLPLLLLCTLTLLYLQPSAQAISIKPADFDRLIMPCYLGGGPSASGYGNGGGGVGGPPGSGPPSAYNSYASTSANTNNMQPMNGLQRDPLNPSAANSMNGAYPSNTNNQLNSARDSFGRGFNGQPQSPASSYQPPVQQPPQPYYGASGGGAGGVNNNNYLGASGGGGSRDGNYLGQSIPRANTIDNFVALVSKIEAANPRLANNPDQLIRSLLGRFRLDNYYYDVRSRTPISEQDRRYSDILPALNLGGGGGQQSQSQFMNSDAFPEQLLEHDEKCSMYFMLSHFIDKTTPLNPSLGQVPVTQLSGPQLGQRPPVLQAAGSGYPGQSANQAFSPGGASGVGGGSRFPGPSPSFGSPITSNMNGFGAGISNQPDYSGKMGPYGVNAPQPVNQFNQASLGGLRQGGAQFSSSPQLYSSQARPVAPYSDGLARSRDERLAIEYGVVTLPNQDNAAIVLNRVLMGMLAATTPPQTIRQLAAAVYPTQAIQTNTPKIDEEIDPLYAVTLADLWAISSIPKAGKPFDIRLLGDNGRWNDTMCPTQFTLERPSSIKFTTAELLGGIDGFNLGMLRRRLMSFRRNIKLSELLRMYYSRSGFRPQFPEVSVCNRQVAFASNLDDLHRQAENYRRLYELNLPISDNEIAHSIGRLEAFRETARQAATQLQPQDICQDSSGGAGDLYPMSPQDQCEIAKADVVSVLDSSPQANQPFLQLVVAKLALKLGLAREGSSLTVMTNQQDTSGYAGSYSFNAIVRNSTNTAEIGCALTHDTSQNYQGGQITDPTRMMEMFERALVSLDTEYLTRQSLLGGGGSSSSSYNRQYSSSSGYVSSWFGQGESAAAASSGYYQPGMGGPKATGGAKVIIWFNYGSQTRPSQLSGSPTNWYPGSSSSSSSSSSASDNQYRFSEAKKYLKENFRGASILAVSSGRDEVKSFVFDQDRDIFSDIPSGSNNAAALSSPMSSSADFYPSSSSDGSSMSMLAGPADQLVGKLMQRICTIPAVFQYPMCFRLPSDNQISVGYISPGRKQYWMMSPKTFFASQSVRMVFKVEGGRLRVCFGRKPAPDETSTRNKDQQQQQQYQQATNIAFGSGTNPNGGLASSTAAPQPSSSDYYTGMEYGVCKDVAPNQEIDFMVSDPCYRRSIAECEPFYFVIREVSNPGEGDPNYMCRDDGCRRFDQAKFYMTHTGVSCSSALKAVQANQFLIMISAIIAIYLMNQAQNYQHQHQQLPPPLPSLKKENNNTNNDNRQLQQTKTSNICNIRLAKGLVVATLTIMGLLAGLGVQQVAGQQANVYDYGQNRYGEKRGSYTPPEVLAIILVIMVILGGLAMTIGLCYYVVKKARQRGMEPVDQDEY